MAITITGAKEAQAATQRLADGCEVAGRTSVVVGASARYAKYVEYGTRRMRARPYLRPALEAVERSLRGRLVAALPQGAQPVAAALTGLGREAVVQAQRVVPVRTGNLRRSIYSTTNGRAR